MTLPRVLPDGARHPGAGAVTVATVPADDAAAERLRSRQQAELAVRYGEPDAGTFTPEAALANVVVRDHGEPVAFVALRDVSGTPDGRGGAHPARTGEVKRLYVEPAHRGRGHARTAMRALHERAVAAGLDRLVLETGTLQPESIDLYLSLGYVPIESYGHYAGQPLSRCFALDLRTERAAAPGSADRQGAAGPGPGAVAGAPVAGAVVLRAVPWRTPTRPRCAVRCTRRRRPCCTPSSSRGSTPLGASRPWTRAWARTSS